jgi:hypothetical protein
MKWIIIIFNLLPRLYSNIICKNIVKIFWKFKVGYTQTCTSMESSLMWHPKGGHHSVVSPICEREFAIPSLPWTKTNWGHPPTHLPHVAEILLLTNAYKDGITFCMHSTSPHSHMRMYTTSCLFVWKCNMMLSFDKLMCKIS